MVPEELRGRVHLKAFEYSPGTKAAKGQPQKHGHFGGECYWDQAFWSVP